MFQVLFHKDDFPDVRAGDVIEVYHPPPPPPPPATSVTADSADMSLDDDEKDFKPRVLLKVDERSIYPDNGATKAVQKNTFYLDKSVAEEFAMRSFQDVIVHKVDVSNNRYCCSI